jgi:hypothetical protein
MPWKHLALLSLLVGLSVALVTGEAWARAGGGQNYSHSSSPNGSPGPSGGWNGRGGGEGIPIDAIIRLLIWYPQISIPLLIIVVVVIYLAQSQAVDAHQTRTIRRGNLALDEARRSQALASLHERDPAFDEQVFLARVDTAFRKIQAAWCAQDLSAVRQFISDGIHERFSLQFREQHEFGYRNQLDNLKVLEIRLEQAVSGNVFEAVTVSITASAVDYNVSLSDGRRTDGATSVNLFVEYWSFLRRTEATTKASAGLVEGFCPNCGAAIELNQWSKCASCGSLLRSGQYDWVLAEITQECEWTPTEDAVAPGVAAYQAAQDSGINQQHLEDRASVIFWRHALADLIGSVAPLRKVATDEFCKSVEAEIVGSSAAPRQFWGNCAVGSVDLRGLVAGDPLDRALVEVRWSGRNMHRGAGGTYRVQPGAGEFRTLLALGRKAGVRTSIDISLASANCPGCGAPESDSTANACEFCGTVLNDGSADWVLLEAAPAESDQAYQWITAARQAEISSGDAAVEVVAGTEAAAGIAEQTSGALAGAPAGSSGSSGAPEGAALLAWLVKMVNVDNEISDRERSALQRFAQRQGVPLPRLNAMIDAALHNSLELPEPADSQQARVWLSTMADMSLVDGKVTREEFDLLSSAGSRLGFDRGKVKELLKQRKQRLYLDARERLRRQNGG